MRHRRRGRGEDETLIGASAPRRGNRASRGLGRGVLGLLGWRIEGSIPDVGRCVAIVAPHTSNWDFVIGLLTILAVGVRVHWLGKAGLFRFPFRRLLRWLGGIPVDRRAPAGVVDAAVALFREREALFLGLSPEGTRKRVVRWKSGFYRIALAAKVPIFPVSLDYRTRVVGLGALVLPTGDYAADLEALRSRFTSAMARWPGCYADPQPQDPDFPLD